MPETDPERQMTVWNFEFGSLGFICDLLFGAGYLSTVKISFIQPAGTMFMYNVDNSNVRCHCQSEKSHRSRANLGKR
jgi:hypothetical protein